MRYHYALVLPLAAALLSATAGLGSAAIPGQAPASGTHAVAAGATGLQLADIERGERSSQDRNSGENERSDRGDRTHR